MLIYIGALSVKKSQELVRAKPFNVLGFSPFTCGRPKILTRVAQNVRYLIQLRRATPHSK